MRSKVQSRTILSCDNCQEEVYKCDMCGEYFSEGEPIFCQLDTTYGQVNNHFCFICAEEDLDEDS